MSHELNIAVHKTLGKTVYKFNHLYYTNFTGLNKIPDYSGDPRLWWPLLSEMIDEYGEITIDKTVEPGRFWYDLKKKNNIYLYTGGGLSIGTAVCEAYVKYKEEI